MEKRDRDEMQRVMKSFANTLLEDAEKEYDWYAAGRTSMNLQETFEAGYSLGYFAALMHDSVGGGE